MIAFIIYIGQNGKRLTEEAQIFAIFVAFFAGIVYNEIQLVYTKYKLAEKQMEKITLKAMAKVNLGLDVIKRLENGYHQVKMIMQTINLYDELTFEKAEQGITLQIDDAYLPADESNLVWRAAALIKEHTPFDGVKISLKKRIPMAAGMAGGSTDAAAVFHGLNRLYDLGMDVARMQRLGVKLGADIPFCIAGGTMKSEGIGEILTPLPAPPAAFLVIAKPDISVSTKYVYENLHVETISHHPNMDAVEQAIRNGDLDAMCHSMENILETVTEKKYPVIAQIKAVLKAAGAQSALMSGSGPTVFGIFKDEERAEAACAELAKSGLAKERFVTTFSQHTCMEEGV